MIMCRWSAKVARPSRPADDQKASPSGSVATMSEYTGTMSRWNPGSVGRPGLRGPHDDVGVDGAAAWSRPPGRPPASPAGCRGPRCARRRRTPRRSTASASPRARSAGCSAAQCGVNVAPRAPSAPISCARLRRARASAGRPRRSPSARASSTAASARARCASLRTRSTDPPLAKWQSMPSAAAAGADDVDGLLHGPPHGAHGVVRRAAGPARRPTWRTAPSTSRRCGPRRRSPPPRARPRRRAATGRPARASGRSTGR